MKHALAWLAGLIGVAALARMLSRRHRHDVDLADESPPPDAADPAEELRRTLAAQRTAEPSGPAEATDTTETLEERRARVHAKAREAMDAMREGGSSA